MTPVKNPRWEKPLGRDAAALDALLAVMAADEPAEHEVARLRRAVRTRLESERPGKNGSVRVTRVLALACSITVGVVSLWMISATNFRPTPSPAIAAAAKSPSVAQVVRLEDGSVSFAFEGTRDVRVTRSFDPAAKTPEQGAVVTVAENGRFVDSEKDQAPGTVVFYRFD